MNPKTHTTLTIGAAVLLAAGWLSGGPGNIVMAQSDDTVEVVTSIEIQLLGRAVTVPTQRDNLGNHILVGSPLEKGTAITHAGYGTFKLDSQPSPGQWTVEPIPSGVPLEVGVLRMNTLAGTGSQGASGDRGPAILARLAGPADVAIDSAGNVLIADTENHRIRKVVSVASYLARAGAISTVAGTEVAGFSGDGRDARQAQLRSPRGIAVGPAGRIYVSDTGNDRVRVIDPDGTINTVAGGGSIEVGLVGGPADRAQLASPHGLAVDRAGSLYIADAENHRIRKVTAGVMTTVAGTGTPAFSGDSGPALLASLRFPKGVAVTESGELYVADTGNNRIRRIARDGVISTVMGNGQRGYSGDGGPAWRATASLPRRVAVGSDGSVYFADSGNHAIRQIDRNGDVATVAGTGSGGSTADGTPAHRAKLYNPLGLALGDDGMLIVADSQNHRVRKLTPGWNVVPKEALPIPVQIALTQEGDWARLWRRRNGTHYHRGQSVASGHYVFGDNRRLYRLDLKGLFGWVATAIPYDPAELFQAVLTSARAGRADAQNAIGTYYFEGFGVEVNVDQAVDWFRLSAAQGDPGGQYSLGVMYENGTGIPKDLVKAVELYTFAARQGHAEAQLELGLNTIYGLGLDTDVEEGLWWVLRAAMRDLARAQNWLGYFLEGYDGAPESYSEAPHWYRLAAMAGYEDAQVRLGILYSNGTGVSADPVEAFRWIRLAAVRGSALGQGWLGHLYESGEGVSQDIAEAVSWYRRAALQEYEWAQWRLGLAYSRGSGVPRNDLIAMAWLELALENGEDQARDEWSTVRTRLTAEEQAAAESLASKCIDSGYRDCP